MKRDKSLDYLRGLAIMQVVVVHILYWINIFSTGTMGIIRSFFLFEMPLFFFVTGAVNSLAKEQPYKSFCVKRVKRLLLPYYVYAAICVLIAVAYYVLVNNLSLETVTSVLLSWLVPISQPEMPLACFSWAIWFVPVYVFSILLFPAVKRLIGRIGTISIILLTVFFLAVESAHFYVRQATDFSGYAAYVYDFLDVIQKVFFYLIFMGLGVLYPKIKRRKTAMTLTSAIVFCLSVAGLLICGLCGITLNMQTNKFPPNYVFLLYSFAVLTALYLVLPIIRLVYLNIIRVVPVFDRFVLFFSKNSIYVFLYQSVPFLVTSMFFGKLGLKNDILVLILALVIVFTAVALTLKLINTFLSWRKKRQVKKSPNKL